MENLKRNILLLSTGDVNGAYEYVYKLALLLNNENHNVAFVVKNKSKTDSFIIQYSEKNKGYKKKSIFKRIIEKIKNKINKPVIIPKIEYDLNYDFISINEIKENIVPDRIIEIINFIPDFIFTGMTDNFINSTDLLNLYKLTNAQIYNITVDMNHFTGGCHFAWDCDGYIKGCTNKCPAILSEHGKETAFLNFNTKYKNAKEANFKILTGSGWTKIQAEKSLIYKNQDKILNINSLIDIEIFNNKNRSFAKQIFNLEQNKFYILMGCQHANAKRKGFEYLIEGLEIFKKTLTKEQIDRIRVLVVSRSNTKKFEDIPFEKQFINYINDYRLLSLLYQATDLFVNSSIEDSGPMMVSEALACGTPVVGFDMGVVNNMVISGYNGYKAELKNSHDLALGMSKMFNLDLNEFKKYSNNASEHVIKYSSYEYAKSFFNEILSNPNKQL